jgi:uncharacterized protein
VRCVVWGASGQRRRCRVVINQCSGVRCQRTHLFDAALDHWTVTRYDLAGRHIRETTVQGGIVFQDNQLAYDAQGNLRSVMDTRVSVLMDYDKAGNRSRIRTWQVQSNGVALESDRYNQFDAMNRQTIVDGIDAAGNIRQGQGHQIRYDLAGNRISDTYWGNKVTAQQVIDRYETRTTKIPVYAGVDESGGNARGHGAAADHYDLFHVAAFRIEKNLRSVFRLPAPAAAPYCPVR